jgi:hypothetical protein
MSYSGQWVYLSADGRKPIISNLTHEPQNFDGNLLEIVPPKPPSMKIVVLGQQQQNPKGNLSGYEQVWGERKPNGEFEYLVFMTKAEALVYHRLVGLLMEFYPEWEKPTFEHFGLAWDAITGFFQRACKEANITAVCPMTLERIV